MAIRLRHSLLRAIALVGVLLVVVFVVSPPSSLSPSIVPTEHSLNTNTKPDTDTSLIDNKLSDKLNTKLLKDQTQSEDQMQAEKENILSTVKKGKADNNKQTSKQEDSSPIFKNGFNLKPNYDGYEASYQIAENYQRQNATILTLCRNQDLTDAIATVRKVEDRFNRNYHYDWVFLNNEPFNQEFQEKIGSLVSGKAQFGVIPKEHWSYPDFIDQEFAGKERDRMDADGVIYASSESYRHMCRFNSGFFFNHPLLQNYKYYWRVEPHVEFWCDVKFDPFKTMVDEKKLYGFTITIHEFERTIETLWSTTLKFIKEYPQYLHKNNFMRFISETNGQTYNLCHFWSNFEIADMDFWRSEAYTEYFNYLDKAGGFFYERWGDAPVHSIAIALFADKDQIHYFKEIGYSHGPYTMCPIEDKVYNDNNCICEKKNDFTFEGYSCGNQYYAAMGLEKPANWKEYS